MEAPVRVAFGVPAAQVAGCRQSHREAVAARHVAERGAGGADRVTVISRRKSHIWPAPTTPRCGLIGRELRAPAGRDTNAARLREMLHAYLKSHRSPKAAACVVTCGVDTLPRVGCVNVER
jgi:hypothetical protein